MLVSDYLTTDFKAAKSHQKPKEILREMQTIGIDHIPLFSKDRFLGNLSKEYLEDLDTDLMLSESIKKEDLEHFKLTDVSTIFDAITSFTISNSNVMPVFNKNDDFLGFILMEDVVNALSKIPFISEPGALIIVRISNKKYSLSEVTKIIESNNARLLGASVYRLTPEYTDVIAKLITENLTSVGETFERFGYTIVEKFYTDNKQSLIKDRYSQFMKYLDI